MLLPLTINAPVTDQIKRGLELDQLLVGWLNSSEKKTSIVFTTIRSTFQVVAETFPHEYVALRERAIKIEQLFTQDLSCVSQHEQDRLARIIQPYLQLTKNETPIQPPKGDPLTKEISVTLENQKYNVLEDLLQDNEAHSSVPGYMTAQKLAAIREAFEALVAACSLQPDLLQACAASIEKIFGQKFSDNTEEEQLRLCVAIQSYLKGNFVEKTSKGTSKQTTQEMEKKEQKEQEFYEGIMQLQKQYELEQKPTITTLPSVTTPPATLTSVLDALGGKLPSFNVIYTPSGKVFAWDKEHNKGIHPVYYADPSSNGAQEISCTFKTALYRGTPALLEITSNNKQIQVETRWGPPGSYILEGRKLTLTDNGDITGSICLLNNEQCCKHQISCPAPFKPYNPKLVV